MSFDRQKLIEACHIVDERQIKGFFGEYRFLSNFWPCKIFFLGEIFDSTEAAYQAAKSSEPAIRKLFVGIGPVEAKRLGKTILMSEDFNDRRRMVMDILMMLKYIPDKELGDRLLATGDRYLEETNWWNDKFWGIDFKTGIGQNQLGQSLMKVRKLLKNLRENNVW